MAYYAIFSLFPLLLILVAAGSLILESDRPSQRVIAAIEGAIPVSQEFIQRNVQQVLELRGPVGVVGLAGLIWSASGVFTVLAETINRAWEEAEPRSLLESRLVGLGIVAGLAVLLVLALLSTTLFNLLPMLQIPLGGGIAIYQTPLWTVAAQLIPILTATLVFGFLYRRVPNTEVPRSAAFGAGLAAALAWRLVTSAFTWYLGSGLARYQLVYGSIGTVVALMFWIYLSSWITVFGAHLSASIARSRRSS